MRRNHSLLAALVAVALIALWTRLEAPARMDVTTDEQHHHLESWRNRYRTDDVFPFFMDRMRQRFDGNAMTLVEWVYRSGPLAQRAMIVLIDPQPPLYPVLAEVIEAVSHSSLLVLRWMSVACGLGAIVMIGLAGRGARDAATGLFAAMLLAIAALPAVQSGLGRPYAMVQLTTSALLLAFVHDSRRPAASSPRGLLVVALIAQGTQWMTWVLAGPLVVTALLRRWERVDRNGMSLRQLAGASWWYVVLSVLLLGYMALQLMNPTISNQSVRPTALQYVRHLAMASPVAHLGVVDPRLLYTGVGLFVALVGLGTWSLLKGSGKWTGRVSDQAGDPSASHRFADREQASVSQAHIQPHNTLSTPARVGLLTCAAAALAAPALIGSHERFWTTYSIPLLLLAAIGLRRLVGRESVCNGCTAVVAVAFLALYVVRPIDGYRWMTDEVPWSRVAAVLNREATPRDRWVSVPYYWANNLYRYLDRHRVASPPMLPSKEDAARLVHARPADQRWFVLGPPVELERLGLTAQAFRRWDFDGRFTILEVASQP